MTSIAIRNEEEAEWRVVEELTRDSFWNYFQPGADEHFLLHKLREHPDFIKELDFVATERGGRIVGSIVYSKAHILKENGSTYEVACFGPVCVHPEYRSKGIGRMLIEHSFAVARNLGYPAVIIRRSEIPWTTSMYIVGFRCGEKYDITSHTGKFSACLMAMPLFPGALDDAAGKFVESDLFSSIDSKELKAFDASFPPRQEEVTTTQMEFNVLRTISYKKVDSRDNSLVVTTVN